MTRMMHGQVLTVGSLRLARQSLERQIAGMSAAAMVAAAPVSLQNFGYLFPALQEDPDALLPESPDTVTHLKALGRTMHDTFGNAADSDTPAAYTYLGQFIDHDITLEAVSAGLPGLLDPALQPLPAQTIKTILRNGRTSPLDLDSLYGFPAPTDGEKLVVNRVTSLNDPTPPFARPDGKDDFNDVPRLPRATIFEHDRAALLGDSRNDENLVISQLHVAFLRAHNALVDQGNSFEDAQRILRQHYQHIVLHDYLPRIADAAVVKRLSQYGPSFYQAMNEPFFMPLEFSVAAFRFGHSMIRARYNFNSNFPTATLELLFTFTALSGGLGGFDTLPENWIVQWEGFFDGPGSKARQFDTKLVEPLFDLPGITGQPMGGGATEEQKDGGRLAVRNLLRGYLLRMPTGQAVARAMGITPLTADELKAAAADPAQADALTAGGFLEKTPLWYYILAEAAVLGAGNKLGPVGSTIVGEVLYGLVMRSDDSILRTPGWVPTLPSRETGSFVLMDLLALAGVTAKTAEPELIAAD